MSVSGWTVPLGASMFGRETSGISPSASAICSFSILEYASVMSGSIWTFAIFIIFPAAGRSALSSVGIIFINAVSSPFGPVMSALIDATSFFVFAFGRRSFALAKISFIFFSIKTVFLLRGGGSFSFQIKTPFNFLCPIKASFFMFYKAAAVERCSVRLCVAFQAKSACLICADIRCAKNAVNAVLEKQKIGDAQKNKKGAD